MWHCYRPGLRQTGGMTAARDLLAKKGKEAGLDRKIWNMDSPQWQGAERELMQGTDALIQRKVASGFWVQEAWSEQVLTILNGEKADEIAVHFRTEGGELQRRVIEWFVGELTLQTARQDKDEHWREVIQPGIYARTGSLIFFGRPPSLPLRRAAADLAFVDALPPILPISAATQRFEPRKPASSAGK